MAKKKAKKKKVTAKRKTTSKKKNQGMSREQVGGILFAFSALLLLSLQSFSYGDVQSNALGLLGYSLGWILVGLFGIGGYIVCGYVAWSGWRMLFSKSINNAFSKHFHITMLILSFGMLLTVIEEQSPAITNWLGSTFFKQAWSQKIHFHLGGAPLYFIYHDIPTFNMNRIFNAVGVTVIFSCTFLSSLFYLTKTDVTNLLNKCTEGCQWIKWKSKEAKEETQRFVSVRGTTETSRDNELMAINPSKKLLARPSLSKKEIVDDEEVKPFEGAKGSTRKLEAARTEPKITLPKTTKREKTQREHALEAQQVYNGDFTTYKLPPLTLLTDPKKVDQSSLKKDLRRQAEVLEETLLSFGIEAKVGQINCGPTITSFEVHPAIGVKVQKIKALESDIALNMEAKSIRILAPIPGKAAIGIEVPNPQPQEVAFKDMLLAYQQSGKKFHIPALLGKTVSGEYLSNDLTKMPHCIIAGATGSGKSVCINTIVMSILMTSKPDEVKLIMVDPKKVELTPYTKLPHMLAPVITEPNGACAALNWLVKEMETRYEILKQVGVRNITSFNTRQINDEAEEQLNIDVPKKMPYIVCIIDELADLMMVASNSIETHIARIAQMARAVGIHLILATQRPSREVITGLIKANFPTRISFKVASRINSQIILDETGAESLLGNGDMLFLPPSSSHLMRAQGAFIRDQDINNTIKKVCEQAPPNYLIKSFDEYMDFDGGISPGLGSDEPTDALYDQAMEIIISTGNASTTFLQRKLKVGYARAASIIDQLEANGVVGPAEGAKPRKILVKAEGEDEL